MIQKYKITLLFAFTALVFIAVTAILVHQIIGRLTENNLARIAEEHASQDALRIESMINGTHSVLALSSGSETGPGDAGGNQSPYLDLEFLAGPNGLPAFFPSLLQGTNIVTFSLVDLNHDVTV